MNTRAAKTATEQELDLVTRRRSEILFGAIQVIARDGVDAAKLKDIARESGVSLGLIQHYFDTRDNLVEQAFNVMIKVLSNEGARRLVNINDPMRLLFALNYLHAHGTVTFPERWGFWSELWAAAGRIDHLSVTATKVYQVWAEPLKAAFVHLDDAGTLPEGADPQRLTTTMLALMDGLSIRTLMRDSDITPDMMLSLLDEWVTVQLAIPAAVASEHRAALTASRDSLSPRHLSPEVIAEALLS